MEPRSQTPRAAIGLLLLLLLPAAACAPARIDPRAAPPGGDVRIEGGVRVFGRSFFRRRDGVWEARFAGTAYERGFARGRLAYAELAEEQKALDFLLRETVPSLLRRWLLRRLLAISIARSKRYLPLERLQETAGLADADFPDPLPHDWNPYARHLSLQALHDFSQRFIDTIPVSAACTGFAAAPPATRDGHVYLARNFDFEAGPQFDREKIVAAIVPERGFPYLSVTFSGLTGVVSGMNSRGLAVAIHALPGAPTLSAGNFSSFVAADILQNDSSVEEATERIRRARILVSDIYLLADAGGHLAAVEKTPDATGVRQARETLVVSNTAETREAAAVMGRPRPGGTSRWRERRMRKLLENLDGKIDAATAAEILRDRAGPDGSDLGIGNRNAINGLISSHSVIFDLTRRRAYVAAAPHALGRFAVFDLDLLRSADAADPRFGELSKSSIPPDPLLSSGGYERYVRARRLNALARRAVAERRWEDAGRDAREAVSLAPTFVEALGCLARIEMALGDFPAATRDFDRAIALSPAPAEFARELALFRSAAASSRRLDRTLLFPLSVEDLFFRREPTNPKP